MRTLLLTLSILSIGFCNLTLAATKSEPMESAFRLKLPKTATIEHPTYFACIITQSDKHKDLNKWLPQPKFTPVLLTNYAHLTQGFAGVGALKTTANYINTHYFKSYHDDDFPKSIEGYVDGFVLWTGYKIECRDITGLVKLPEGTTHAQFHGKILLKLNGKTYPLTLAGRDYT